MALHNEIFSIKHHALLFSIIAKHSKKILGDKADETLKNAVIRYALGRGGRMGKRALKDGNELNAFNYIVYGEWDSSKELVMDADFMAKEASMKVKKCPWYTIWEEAGHLEYGKIYCDYIDATLAKGFGGDVVLDVESTRTRGAETCDFFFRGKSFEEKELYELFAIKKSLGNRAMKDWEYHTAHLYFSMKEVFLLEHKEIGEKVLEKALVDYSKEFSEEAVGVILGYSDMDFSSVEDYAFIEK